MKRVLLISLGLSVLPACQTDTSRLPEVPPYAIPEDAVTETEPSDSTDASDTELDDDLWTHVRTGFQLDLPDDPAARAEVDKQIRFFSKYHKSVADSLNRANPYLYLVVKEIEKRDLPMELALLPIIESSYNPKAKSANGAGGLWQFMPGTAKVLGLKKNTYYDAKHDVFASTQAALDYLGTLNKTFDGDWYQTLAAYNAGAGTVQRAQQSNRARGKKDDFWDLKSLQPHTREYVPKLLALAQILKDPDKYGVDWDPVANSPVMRKVDLNKPIALSEAAELANCRLEDLVAMNPGFTKPWAVSGGPGYLMVPAKSAEHFEEQLSHLPAAREADYVTYTVKEGDRLTAIARQYHVSQEVLRQVNHIYGTRDPKPGRELKIPLSNKPIFDDEPDTELAATESYKVKRGDTLWKLAKSFKVSSQALADANGIKANAALKPGQTLRIPASKARAASTVAVAKAEPAKKPAAAPSGKQQIRYTVQKGDSLSRIAMKHKIAIKDLLSWNQNVTAKNLKPGQSLTLFLDANSPALAAKS